jgi:hypothetical protein
MASFTDEIHRFNPYIPKLPVDAMASAEINRQQEYEQGVQKVDNYFTTLGGLPVADKFKPYLDSKIGELQNSVRGVASADFSDNQLVNQIGALAGKIANDPIVQNGVISTSNIRRGFSDIEDEKRKGDKGGLNPANEWDFQDQVAKWSQDTDLSHPFTGSYTPDTHYMNKVLEAVKAVEPDSQVIDDPYNQQGGVAIGMTSTKIKTKSPEKVQAAINSVLNSGDYNQMAIEGRFQYRQFKTKDQLNDQLFDNYNQTRKQYSSNLTDVTAERNQNSGNAEAVNRANQKVRMIQKGIQDLDDQYARTRNILDRDDLDGAKAQLYTNAKLHDLTASLSSSDTEFTWKNNPLFEAQMQQENLALRLKEFQDNHAFHEKELNLREREYQLKFAKATAKPGSDIQGYEGVTQVVDPTIAVDDFMSRANSFQKVSDDTKFNYFATQHPELITTDPNGNITYKDQAAKDKGDAIWQSALKTGLDGNQPNPILSSAIQKAKSASDNWQDMTAALNNANRAADRVGLSTNQAYKGMVPLNLYNSQGHVVSSISPEDAYNAISKYEAVTREAFDKPSFDRTGKRIGNDQVAFDSRMDGALTSPTEKAILNIYRKMQSGIALSPVEQKIISFVGNTGTQVSQNTSDILDKRNQFISQQLSLGNRYGTTTNYMIPTEKSAFWRSAQAPILQKVLDANETGNADPNFSRSKAEKALADDKSSFIISYNPGSLTGAENYTLHINSAKEGNTEMTISKEDAKSLLGRDVFTDSGRPWKDKIALSGQRMTTNIRGDGINTPGLTKDQFFPNVKNYGVAGDIFEDPNNRGNYSLRLYVTNPATKKQYTLDVPTQLPLPSDKINAIMAAMNDSWISELISGNRNATFENEVSPLQLVGANYKEIDKDEETENQ